MSSFHRATAALVFAIFGCDPPAPLTPTFHEEGDADVGHASSEVRGEIHFNRDCSPEMKSFVEESVFMARVAASSNAVRECLNDAINGSGADFFDHDLTTRQTFANAIGPYRSCSDDPFASDAAGVQLARVVEMMESENDLEVVCTGGSGNASVAVGDMHPWGHDERERTSLGAWFGNNLSQLNNDDVCSFSDRGVRPGCRWAPYPWPYSQAAGILWHEAAHTHSYSHGTNDQSTAPTACNRSGTPGWHYQVNTMPYLLGGCIDTVISDSGWHCGDINSCPNGQLRLVSTYGGPNCECVSATPGTAEYPVRVEARGWGVAGEAPWVTVDVERFCLGCLVHYSGVTRGLLSTRREAVEGTPITLRAHSGNLDCSTSEPTTMPAGGFRKPLRATCYDTAQIMAIL